MKKISLIIPTTRGVTQLPQINAEVIIIENGAEAKSTAEAKIISFSTPIGFARSCNEGAKAAVGDILFFLNDDTEIVKNDLPALLEHFSDPKVFAISPKVVRPSQGGMNESIILGAFRGGVINALFSETKDIALPDLPLEVFSGCGAAMLIDREKFFELGGFDEVFSPCYYEETDLFYRAQKRGWKIIYAPSTIIHHLHNQTIGSFYNKNRALVFYWRNQLLCTWKNISDPWMKILHFFNLIPMLISPLKFIALIEALKRIPVLVRRRRFEKKLWRLSDRSVFKKAAALTRAIRMKASVKKILVIRPDAIGDLVLTLPAIQTLKKKFPQAEITALIREYTKPVLENHPAIDKFIFDYNFIDHKFDLCVNFYNQGRDSFSVLKAGIPYRLGDSARIMTGWMNNLRVFRKWDDFTRHEVKFNLDLLNPLGIMEEEITPKIYIDKEANKRIAPLLQEAGISLSDFIVGVHIGADGSHNKAWNTIAYADVINWLSEEKKAKIILTGPKEAIEKADKILHLCKTPALNLVGKIELNELIALTSKYKFYFGTDTGPTHIAAAFKVPLVALFLSKRAKPLRWGPWQTRHLVVKNCSQCGKSCTPPVCKDALCSNEVLPQEVIAACEKVLNGFGVQEKEETLYHWCQQSFSIAILYDEKNKDWAEKILKLLEDGGYRACLTKEKHPLKLLNLMIKEDVSVMHRLEGFPMISAWIARLLSGSYLSNTPLLVDDKGIIFDNTLALINSYVRKFRKIV